jgi:sugar/nucleoside kinase (ribokinase family)/nucleoside 2-deoxyribosyltransferase
LAAPTPNFHFDIVVIGDCPRDLFKDFNPFIERPGGSIYSAMVASALGARVALLGDIGDDEHAHTALRMLDNWGIDSRGVESLPGPTPTYGIHNCDEIIPQVVTSLGTRFRASRSSDVPQDYFPARTLLMYPYNPDLLLDLASGVRDSGGKVYFDLQHDVLSLDAWADILKLCDVVFTSGSEILNITSQPDISLAAKEILKIGPRLVIVKLGLGGSLAIQASGTTTPIPCFQSRFKCTIGAGDAYNAAFVVTGIRQGDITHSGEVASIVASLFVERLSLDEIHENIRTMDLSTEIHSRTSVFVPPSKTQSVKIYLAGHFLSTPARAWVYKIASALSSRGFKVIVPHINVGVLPHAPSISDRRQVFEGDIKEIASAHLVVALLDGAGRGGTSWEIGYANAIGIPVIGLLTDPSRLPSNMIYQSCISISASPNQLLNQLYDMLHSGEILH